MLSIAPRKSLAFSFTILHFHYFNLGIKFPCPFIQQRRNQLLGSCFDRSEENVGLVNGDYEKRTSISECFQVGLLLFLNRMNRSLWEEAVMDGILEL